MKEIRINGVDENGVEHLIIGLPIDLFVGPDVYKITFYAARNPNNQESLVFYNAEMVRAWQEEYSETTLEPMKGER